MKKFIATIALAAFILSITATATLPTRADAAYTDQSGTSYSNQIAALQAYLVQLTTLLDVLKKLQAERFGGAAEFNTITREAASIEDSTATLHGRIDTDSDASLTVWFELGTDEDELDTATTKQTIDSADEKEFSRNVAGLDPDTTYFFRAVAQMSTAPDYGMVLSFTTNEQEDTSGRPIAHTDEATRIERGSAYLNGSVDMQEFTNGIVFFVYGSDEDAVEEIPDEYEEKDDIETDKDRINVVDADSELDREESYSEFTDGPRGDTEYFYRMCVEFENEDDDEEIVCGDTETFTTPQ